LPVVPISTPRRGIEEIALHPPLARSFASLPASSLRDAFERANTLAKGSGSRVGALQSASQGVIKILARGEIDNNEYGRD
jgi:hypothetical protein